MRILTILHSFEPGGVERTALKLCAQWRDAGLGVAVMVGRPSGYMREQAPDLDYHYAPMPGFPTGRCETLWMIAWLPGILRRFRPDILFCPGNSYTIVAIAMKLIMGRRCPPIVAKISNDLARPDMAVPIRLFYHLWCLIQGRMIDHWVALSDAMAAESAILLGVAPGSISVVADAVLDVPDMERLREAGARARASRRPGRRFLAAGRLVSQKNFGDLIEAFAQGGQPHDRLVIVGEGPSRRKLARQISRLGLEDRVRLSGHCPTIASHLEHSDVLVLSSRYEGLPAVIVEAMAAGTSIIATDCCASMRPLVDDPMIGTVVPTGAVGALALSIALARPSDEPSLAVERASAFRADLAAPAYHGIFLEQLRHAEESGRIADTEEEFA